METIEIWKDVPGYEGVYQASNMGRVRGIDRMVKHSSHKALRRQHGTILSPRTARIGYQVVSLRVDGQRKLLGVHRIVAQTFLEPKEGCNEVNHIDFNKTNNAVTNLEWLSKTDNRQHAIDNGRWNVPRVAAQGCKNHKAIFGYDDILKIRSLIKEGHKDKEIAESYNCAAHTIWKIKKGLSYKFE